MIHLETTLYVRERMVPFGNDTPTRNIRLILNAVMPMSRAYGLRAYVFRRTFAHKLHRRFPYFSFKTLTEQFRIPPLPEFSEHWAHESARINRV